MFMGSVAAIVAEAKKGMGHGYQEYTAIFGGGCYSWCASFISTIAQKTGNGGCIPKDTHCTSQMEWFKAKNLFHPRTSGYKPKVGDLIYFDYDFTGDADHVALVVEVGASSCKTIEGCIDPNDNPRTAKVDSLTRQYTYTAITGYASPAYGTSSPGDEAVVDSLDAAVGGDVTEAGLLTDEDLGYSPDFEKYAEVIAAMSTSFTASELQNMHQISKLRGIIGVPPQFLPSTDLRLGYNSNVDAFSIQNMGTDYLKSIASKMPLVYLTPCEPVFLPSLSGSDRKQGLEKYVKALADSADTTALDSLMDDYSGKLYSVEHCYEKYFSYVNPACRAMAEFLQLENPIYDSVRGTMKPYSYNWAWNYLDSEDVEVGSDEMLGADGKLSFWDKVEDMQRVAYYRGSIPIYANAELSTSREFSNSTTQSQLASSVNALSDQARELQYILGLSSSTMGLKFDEIKDQLSGDIDSLNDFVSKLPVGGGLFSTIVSGINTCIAGGKLMFPELWNESDCSESYNISYRLVAPDPDNFSIWEYVLCPLIHSWGLVSPRQSDKHGYISPFLVKGFCKGIFNIDMGIITNMNVNIGKENCWNKDGLPTVVEVQMTLKNLYNQMSMTSMSNMKYGMMANIAEMDFLANLCGVNYNVPDAARYAKMYADLNIVSRITDIPTNVATLWQRMSDNTIVNLSNKLSRRY